jgi:hypothetical protein
MAVAMDDFTAWIEQANIPESCRTTELDTLLAAVWRFRQQQGTDYYSTRLLSHFLLHADTGLKVAHIARLLGISRPNASAQQKLSSKDVIKQAHHRLDGRPHGKLLPRYAGAIAAYLLGHPDATRADVLDFIQRTFGVQVSRIALYKFLKKYGLQDVTAATPSAAQANATVEDTTTATLVSPAATPTTPPLAPTPTLGSAEPLTPVPAVLEAVIERARTIAPGNSSAPPFSSGGRNTPVPSC